MRNHWTVLALTTAVAITASAGCRDTSDIIPPNACCDTTTVGVTLTPSTAEIAVGDSLQFKLGENWIPRGPWDWSSSDTAVATVHPDSGRAYARRAGQATIIARSRTNGSLAGAAVLIVR